MSSDSTADKQESRGEQSFTEVVLYHEQQRLGYCAVHCLNNLLQNAAAASFESLRDIAQRLQRRDRESGITDGGLWSSLFNPYMSAVPQLGYFDINCIVAALEPLQCRVAHHFAGAAQFASCSEALDQLRDAGDASVLGLIVNVTTESLGGLYRGSHWFAVLRVTDATKYSSAAASAEVHPPGPATITVDVSSASKPFFVNLDSNLRFPVLLPSCNALCGFVDDCLRREHGQVFIVQREEIALTDNAGE